MESTVRWDVFGTESSFKSHVPLAKEETLLLGIPKEIEYHMSIVFVFVGKAMKKDMQKDARSTFFLLHFFFQGDSPNQLLSVWICSQPSS